MSSRPLGGNANAPETSCAVYSSQVSRQSWLSGRELSWQRQGFGNPKARRRVSVTISAIVDHFGAKASTTFSNRGKLFTGHR